MNKPVPYTLDREYKAPSLTSLALDLLYAALGTVVIIAASAYGLGLL